jgi:hypothetical protein
LAVEPGWLRPVRCAVMSPLRIGHFISPSIECDRRSWACLALGS